MRKSHNFLGPYTNIILFSQPCLRSQGRSHPQVRIVGLPSGSLTPISSFADSATLSLTLLANSAFVKSPQTSASSSTDKRLTLFFPTFHQKPSKIKNYKFDFSAKEKKRAWHGMDGRKCGNSYSYALFSKNPSCARIWGFSLE